MHFRVTTTLFLACLLTSAALGANIIVNGSFEIPVLPGTTVAQVNEALVPGWETTASDSLIELWSNGFNGVFSADAAQHAELNAQQVSTLYQDITGIPGNAVVGYSFAHRGRLGVDTMALQVSDLGSDNASGGIGPAADTTLFNQQFSTGNNAWVQYSAPTIGNLTLGNDMRFAFVSISAAGSNAAIGNFLDNVSFGIGVPEPASVGLLALGLCGLGGFLARRRRSWRKTIAVTASLLIVMALNTAAHATIVTFKQGFGGYSLAEDTFLYAANPNSNFGSGTGLGVENAGASNEFQSLLAFYGIVGGGPGQIPLNATINSATLGVFNTSVTAGASGTIHRMLVPWSELGATWNSFNGGLNNVPAGEFVAAPSHNGPIGGGPFIVTSIVQAWVSGFPNYGVAFIPNGPPNTGIAFQSSEAGNAQAHPILTVDYSVPEPMTLGMLATACAALLLANVRRKR